MAPPAPFTVTAPEPVVMSTVFSTAPTPIAADCVRTVTGPSWISMPALPAVDYNPDKPHTVRSFERSAWKAMRCGA
jgi:hypothetical protein